MSTGAGTRSPDTASDRLGLGIVSASPSMSIDSELAPRVRSSASTEPPCARNETDGEGMFTFVAFAASAAEVISSEDEEESEVTGHISVQLKPVNQGAGHQRVDERLGCEEPQHCR